MSTGQGATVSLLGGETRRRNLFGSFTGGQIAVMTGASVLWLVVLLVSQSFAVLVVGALGLLGLSWLLRRQDSSGDSWGRTRGEGLWFWLRRRRGLDVWSPGGDLPTSVGAFRELTYADDPDAPPVALVHQRDRAQRFGPQSSLVAVLEIVGGGDGLREVSEVNRRGSRFGQLLGTLASPESPVEQIDIETRVVPADPGAYAGEMAAMLTPGCPPALRASMEQLAAHGAAQTETYRTFATVRMPLAAVQARVVGRVASAEDTVVAAVDALRVVVDRLERSGHVVRGVLGPRRVAAMVRHLHVPSFGIDDLDGLERIRDGWAFPITPMRDAVRVDGPDGPWFHAVASVPRDSWPMDVVGMRWMQNLVTDVNPATIRTVKAQHRLVPKRLARGKATIGLTLDTAAIRSREKKQAVSTGEDEASATAAQRIMNDLLGAGTAGDHAAVRIIVSAPDLGALTVARSAVSAAAEDSGITRLRWYENRHHQALQLGAPLARGIRS
ncbi:SCO6880 family protein [Solicola sp. PLA-1-18]|uniref:SCO6880 family protein n=1 Tax=Solicola sp. PLA-1-18 TaxID=3380532 RepID=UPI003B78607E